MAVKNLAIFENNWDRFASILVYLYRSFNSPPVLAKEGEYLEFKDSGIVMGRLPFMEHNVKKIISGQKKTTLRTYKLKDGYYSLNKDYEILIKLRGLLGVDECPSIVESEAFENGPVFQSTKDFLNGDRKLYVYDILDVVKIGREK